MNPNEEFIDVLDATGAKTGRIASRAEVHRDGLWHRIAVVAILDDHGRILLQQRSATKLTNAGKWDVAAAGHIAAGEDSLTAAQREVEEEVGIVAQNLEFLLSDKKESEHFLPDKHIIDKQFFDCYILRQAKIDVKNLKLQTSEVQAAKLCTPAEFEAMIASGVMVNRKPLYDKLLKIMSQAQ